MRTTISLLFVSALLLVGCKSSDPPLRDAGPRVDQTICKRPTFALCETPPFGSSCPDRYFCPGCNCAGQAPAPACNPITQDCRYFCDGCYPEEYVLCDANTAQTMPSIAGRCGYCFIDGDGDPSKCNVLGDAGATPRDAG